MLKYLEHDLIDQERWDETIENSVNGYVYAFSWFLNIVSPGWNAIIQDDYKAVMPLPNRKKLGVNYIFTPHFVQQLGIFTTGNVSDVDLKLFIEAIPKKYRLVELNLNKFLITRESGDFIFKPNRNLELDLSHDYQKIYSGYSTNLKRNLKKADNNNLTIVGHLKPEQVVDLFKANKGKEIKSYSDADYRNLIRLIFMLIYRGKGEVNGVINEKNEVLAAALFVKSNGRIIFLFSGMNDEGKRVGAMPFLIDKTIQQNSPGNWVFDFEGSNDDNLARFYSSFGAEEFSYKNLTINKLPFIYKLAKRVL